MAVTPCRPKWKGTMSDRERFDNQMHYRPFDRTVNMEFGYWQENFEVWEGFVENGIRNNGEADVFFSFDRMGSMGPAWILPAFERKVISETETSQVVRDANGLIAEVPKDGHSTIPRFLGSSIQTPDDWAEVKAEHFDPDHPGRRPDVEGLKQRFAGERDFPLGVGTGSMIGRIRDLLTIEGLSYAIYDYPQMVEDMIETACVLVEQYLDAVLPHVAFDFACGWEDICFNHGPLVSVEFFERVVCPRYKRIAGKLHAHGVDIWYTDCDGDVRPLLPGFLRGGINCLFPYEVHSCTHPAELLAEYGKDLRIMGGVDKMELAKGPKAIKAYLDTLVPLVERGGYIPFCDHRCPPNVRYDDYLYYLDLKEEMFGLA